MFFIILTLIAGDSLRINNLLLSPERIKALDILQRMGGEIVIDREEITNCGRCGDIYVKKSSLINIEIFSDEIPLIIDEIPALTIAGIFAEGGFMIRDAKELRIKETDRIDAIVKNLQFCGVETVEYEDGFLAYGKDIYDDAVFESFGDHRIAMAFSVLASLLNDGGVIKDPECVAVSNPSFYKQLLSIVR
jgi:3-phosphoshikimate 1-carboxyvinyltransferase